MKRCWCSLCVASIYVTPFPFSPSFAGQPSRNLSHSPLFPTPFITYLYSSLTFLSPFSFLHSLYFPSCLLFPRLQNLPLSFFNLSILFSLSSSDIFPFSCLVPLLYRVIFFSFSCFSFSLPMFSVSSPSLTFLISQHFLPPRYLFPSVWPYTLPSYASSQTIFIPSHFPSLSPDPSISSPHPHIPPSPGLLMLPPSLAHDYPPSKPTFSLFPFHSFSSPSHLLSLPSFPS